VRGRKAAMAWLARNHVKQSSATEFNALSLGGGTDLPMIETAKELERLFGLSPDLTNVDHDIGALALSRVNAQMHGIDKGRFRTVAANLASRDFDLAIAGQYDFQEFHGLLDYFPRLMAANLIAGSFQHLKDGGRMVVANIADSHPQQSFLKDIVLWEGLRYRSEDDMLDLADAAGVTQDPSNQINVYRTRNSETKVQHYTVLDIKKGNSLEAENTLN
jgi:hypothetical protein